MAAAAAFLGCPYTVEGEVVVGDRRGGPVLGMPTANLAVPGGIVFPADGVYAGYRTDGADGVARSSRSASAPTPSSAPTGGSRATCSTSTPTCTATASVGFTHHLRDQAVFAGTDELIAQMRADIDQAWRLLSSPPGGTVRTGGFPRLTP